jgi:2-polyprenyl-3-methyl-5-hydroxy-6-metoxy-1,4-benzoquinol methylase
MIAPGWRSHAEELMDVEELDLATLEACLRDLERINRWTGAYRITLRWLERLRRAHRLQRLAIIDVGSGYGDMLRRIGAWGKGRGLAIELIGVDRNPHAATAAARATPSGPQVRYVTADAFDLPSGFHADAVISALFAHHLDDRQLVRFLRWMDANARFGWLVNDLHRHTIPYWIACWTPGLLGMNAIVQHDAPISVTRAFARADWVRLLDQAGLAAPPTTVRWCFPFRYAVGRIRSP